MSGLSTAISNTATATNVVQIADGALNETNSLLLQIRGLAVSAANSGANDSTSLAADQAQITNAIQTIDNIAKTTQFGSTTLLDGSHDGTASATTSDNTTGVTATATSSATPGTYTVSNVTLATAATVEGSLSTEYTSTGNAALAVGQKETFTITDGNSKSANVTLDNTSGTSALTVQNVISAINTATGNGSTVGVTASFDTSTGQIKLTSTTTGSSAGITISGDSLTGTIPGGTGFTSNDTAFGTTASGSPPPPPTAATLSGSTTFAATTDAALNAGQKETLTISDGTNSANVDLDNTTGTSALSVQDVINQINTATDNGTTVGVQASFSGGHIVLTSTATGSGAEVDVSSDSVTNPAGTGFTNASNPTTGTDISATVNNGTTSTSVTGTGNTLTAATGLTFAVNPATYSTSGGTNGDTVVTVAASNALVFQIGANAGDTASLSIASAASTALGQNAAATPGSGESQNQFSSLNAIDVTKNASDAIEVVDKAINDVLDLAGQSRRLPGQYLAGDRRQPANVFAKHDGGRFDHPRYRLRLGDGQLHPGPGAGAGGHASAEERQPDSAAGADAAAVTAFRNCGMGERGRVSAPSETRTRGATRPRSPSCENYVYAASGPLHQRAAWDRERRFSPRPDDNRATRSQAPCITHLVEHTHVLALVGRQLDSQ